MSKKTVTVPTLLVAWLVVFGTTESPGDTVSTPRRMFGLGDVRGIAVSPDLRFLATGGQGGAFLWDVDSATLRQRLEVDWSVTALAFSSDNRILTGASGTTISAWDTETGTPLQRFVGHTREIVRLRFSAGDQQLVSASADNTVRIWSVKTGEQTHSFRTPGSAIVDVAISPDGQKLATVDTFLTNCVKIWDIATETQIRVLPKTNWFAQRCLFTPGGQLLTTEADRTIRLWNTETGEEIRSFPGITNVTTIIADVWLPNDSTVAAICNDGSVFLWNLETAALVRVVAGDPVIAAIGVPYESLSIAANLDHNIRIRQLPGGDTLRTFKGHNTSTHSAVAFSPDGRYVLSGGTEESTRLWDRQTAQPIREFLGSPAGTMAAAFSSDGSRVLTTAGPPHPAVRLWNTETGELEREFKWTKTWPSSAVFSHDGTKIAARSQAEGVTLFDVATGTVLKTIPNPAYASAIALSPSAPLLAMASTEYTADLYNRESGQKLHTFDANAGPVISVAFSPNGDTLLIAWQDGLIRLYNTFTTELRREFVTPAAFLEKAVYSPDGRYILTGEGWPLFTATLWDAQTAEPLRTFQGHKWSVGAAAFSSDGTSILTGAELVREWSITSIVARLSFERLSNNLRLAWKTGELQHATQPDGPWETLTNAVSPVTFPLADPARFYRVRTSTAE